MSDFDRFRDQMLAASHADRYRRERNEARAERGRYRAALERIVRNDSGVELDSTGEDLVDIAREALNPPAAEPVANVPRVSDEQQYRSLVRQAWQGHLQGRDGERVHAPDECPPAEDERPPCDCAALLIETNSHEEHCSSWGTEGDRACGCTVSVQLDGSDRCDACGGWVS